MASRAPTPLLDALRSYGGGDRLRFHMPGHKGMPLYGDLWPEVCALDVTELPCTGDLYRDTHVGSPIRQAEAMYAAAYGVSEVQFLTGGASQGIFAMLYAAAKPGDTILVDRLCHQSVCHAMALLGLTPVYLFRDFRESDGVTLPLEPDVLEREFGRGGKCAAVIVTSPSYHGVCCELDAMSRICKKHGVPLLVDAAHGAHLPFMPESVFGGGYGRDLNCVSAAVLSAHKTLPALGQSAFLLSGGSDSPFQISAQRLRTGTQIYGTSSPSYALMASLDAARAFLDEQGMTAGKTLCGMLEDCPGKIRVTGARGLVLDPLRLTLRFADAAPVAKWLAGQGVIPEMCDSHTIVLIISLAERPETVSRLLEILERLCDQMCGLLLPPDDGRRKAPPEPEIAMGLREAFFCEKTVRLPLKDAAGRIAAAPLTPYPPGIPLLMPGERLDKNAAELYPEQVHSFVDVGNL